MARGMLFPAGLMVLIVVLVHDACSGYDSNHHSYRSEATMFMDMNPAPGSANKNNEGPSTINSQTTSAVEDCKTPSPERQRLGKHDSSNSNNEAGSIQPQRLIFSSAILEEIPAASVKLMMKGVHFDAHFQVLETQFALMQNQISTLIRTMKEVHSAFLVHQDPVD